MKKIRFNASFIRICILIGVFLSTQTQAFSQTKPIAKPITSEELAFWLMGTMVLGVSMLVLLTAVYVLYAVQYMILDKQGTAKTEGVWGSLWKSLDRKFTNAIPIQQEQTILLDHNYDGIRELDNHLPPWWLYLFYGCIVWGVGYMMVYHVWGTFPLPANEYVQEEQAAQIQIEAYKKLAANSIDETNAKLIKDKTALANAKSSYDINCKSCHGAKGEGGIGPNLTDEYWLHGGSIQEIFKSIKYGIPQKGMIAWEKKLTPNDIQSMGSYILSMQGSKPSNAKAPQGEKAKKKK